MTSSSISADDNTPSKPADAERDSIEDPVTPAKPKNVDVAAMAGTVYRGTKRQRLDTATSVLKKPFRSPLLAKRDEATGPTVPTPRGLLETPIRTAIKSSIFPSASTATPINCSRTSTSINGSQATAVNRLNLPIPPGKPINPSFHLPTSSKSKSLLKTSDSELQALISQNTSLKTKLKAAQAHLSITQQALLLESLPPTHKDSDQHLERLIIKWKNVAREASEFLYGVAMDKVNRMGGAEVWFQRERKRRQNGWSDEPEPQQEPEQDDDGDDELDEEAKQYRDELRSRLEKRDLYAEYDIDPTSLKKSEPSIPDKEPQSFTMEVFLRFMNVDLDKIGWDAVKQCWRD